MKENMEEKLVYFFQSIELPEMKLIDYLEVKKSSMEDIGAGNWE